VAIPVGLIVTEAVSNALVHAFAGTRDPQIFIRICKTDGTFEMSVEDNGVGIAPDAPALNGQGGLGFTLLHGLAAQLEGELSVSPRSEGGTRVLLKFPDSQRGSRTADDGHRSAGRPSAPA
jgi:two-component sensor histidine kinase